MARYDGVTFKVLSHDTDPNFTSDDVSSMAQDRTDTLWFGTADGLIEESHGHTRRFAEPDGLPAASIVSLSITADGSLLAATTAGLATFDGSRFKLLASGSGEASGSLQGSTTGPDGVQWTWDKNELIAKKAGEIFILRVGKELPGARVHAVLIDREGAAWIGTNRGLSKISAAGAHVIAVPEVGVNSVLALLQDAEGNFWIGTETSGLHVLRPRKFRGLPAIADDEVSCVVQASDGWMWFGTRDDGLRRMDANDSRRAVERPAPNAALTSPVILSLAAGSHGDVWAGTPDGLNHVEANGRTTRYTSSEGLPDDFIRSLLVSADGTLWVGTGRGLARLVAGRVTNLTRADGPGGDLIGVLHEVAQATPVGTAGLWFGTLEGLSRLHDGAITTYGRADGLSTSLVTGIASDTAGHLWVATRDQGLFRLDGRTFWNIRAAGLSRELEGIVADHPGFLWLRGRRGVTRVAISELNACLSQSTCQPRLAIYGVQDGMPDEQIVANGEPSAWLTNTGELWFATRKGVAITDPSALPLNTVPPRIVIERFLVDNDEVEFWNDNLSITSGHERYTFDFAGMSFTVPSKVLYRFKLEGFDRDWSTPAIRRTATYTNLPPARYLFRVQAANNDGLWNDTGVVLRFRILPPFYRRWWFLLGSLLLLCGLALALSRLRMRRVRQSFDALLAERNRIAREIHDTLAQDFVGVLLQLDLASHLLAGDRVREAAAQLHATRRFVQSGLEEARQSIWNLRANTAHDSLPAGVAALVKRFSADSLTVKSKIGGAYRPLAPVVEEEVLRILQEALSNVERHADANTASVHLRYEEDTLIMDVDDNGRGFSTIEAEAKTGHFGLQGMRERAQLIGAELHVRSSATDGTALRLVVPIAAQKG